MARNTKGLQAKAREMKVRKVRPNWFMVINPENGHKHDVVLGLNGGTCTCEYGKHRPAHDHRSGCSHVIAAVAAKTGKHVKVFGDVTAARKAKHAVMDIGDGLVLTLR